MFVTDEPLLLTVNVRDFVTTGRCKGTNHLIAKPNLTEFE